MKIKNLMVRCYAKKQDGQWSAVCLDLGLAAQADDFPAVQEKIKSMIETYIFDATQGDDSEYTNQLLNRKAPPSLWLDYYLLRLKRFLTPSVEKEIKKRGIAKSASSKEIFIQGLPLTLAH